MALGLSRESGLAPPVQGLHEQVDRFPMRSPEALALRPEQGDTLRELQMLIKTLGERLNDLSSRRP